MPDIGTLLETQPQEALRWLKSVQAGDMLMSGDVHWLGIAQCAASLACGDLETQHDNDFVWAEAAIVAYAIWSQSDKHVHDSLQRIMRVRAMMILKYGPRSGYTILDLQAIESWFMDEMRLSIDLVRGKLSARQNFGREEINELRHIKNLINVIIELVRRQYIKRPEILAWVQLLPELP